MHFGTALRLLRVDTGVSLRDLARRIGVSSAYLSRVEHGHDPPPTPDRLAAIARALDLPPLLLVELSGQAGPLVSSYMARTPAAASLFFDIARRDLSNAEVSRLRALVDREFPGRRAERRRAVRLRPLVADRAVILDLLCDDIEDVVDTAVGRLGLPDGGAARALAGRILARERESPSLVGGGVALPHAFGSHESTAAALVLLRRPLPATTPDRRPVSIAVVLTGPGGRASLELLAHVARLAGRGLADDLAGLDRADRVLARLDALESA